MSKRKFGFDGFGINRQSTYNFERSQAPQRLYVPPSSRHGHDNYEDTDLDNIDYDDKDAAGNDNKADGDGGGGNNGGDEEIDPLDAFMEGIHEEMRTAAPPQPKEKAEDRYKDDEEDDPMESFLRAKKDLGLTLASEALHAGYDSDEEVYAAAKAVDAGMIEYDSDDNPIVLDKKKIEPIPALDHSSIDYEPFNKDFYEEAPSISGMSEQDVTEYRKSLAIRVSGFDVPKPIKTFEDCGFSQQIMGAIKKQGYEKPTSIQCQSLPVILSGRDIIGIAKTGSGKTAAFVLPMIVHIMDQPELQKEEGPIGVICAPTRELAHQIYLESKKFAKAYGIRVSAVYGGMSKLEQFKELKAGCEIVVATPGRLIDMLKMKALTMTRATYLVLDEADRMFDLGFEPQVRSIVGQIRPDRQTLLFSATMPRKVEKLAREILSDPVRVTVGEVGMANEDITQVVHVIASDAEKLPWLLEKLPEMIDQGDVLVFASKKATVDEIESQLAQRGFKVAALHGDKDQASRMETLQKFKAGVYHVLIATDVAARGLDIKSIKSVVNFDIAKDMELILHKKLLGDIGRQPPSLASDRPLLVDDHGSKHFSFHGTPVVAVSPANPPAYGPFMSTSHPPGSSHFSVPFKKKTELQPPVSGFKDIAPIHSAGATTPSSLAQPPLAPYVSNCCKQDMVLKRGSKSCQCVYPIKLDLLLLNVSQSRTWNDFLDELATHLGLRSTQIELVNFYVIGLSTLNMSMDITPYKGIGFSASQAAKINSSLSMHKIQLDPKLVGDYKVINITWFQPPPPSPAPAYAASPVNTPLYHAPTAESSSSSNSGRHSNLFLILGIAIGLLFIAIISILALCLCTLLPKAKEPPVESEKPRTESAVSAVGSLPHPSSTRFIAYEELKEATNNFEPASVLGEGGFGRVFKGVLNDGTAVAIKRLTSGGQQGDKEFLVEVEMLSRLHHRNLVKLVGYYSNRDSSQNLLCYELVPNGSLEAWLHGPLGINCPLDWDTRMKIALDAARGLCYLHEDSQPCVIHRDFKASNILLENNFHAKVADFGLAKQAPEGRANYLSTRVMGTFGYVAPEYAMTGHLLVKSDVYSYGVVLLELLTGRKPVDMSQPTGQENLVTWARPILRDKDRLEEIADPKLGGKYPKEDFVRVCTIAAACVAPEANQRPTMGEVVQSLKMVQRITEYQDSMIPSANTRANLRQSSSTFEFDGTSSMFSSGPYSGLSAFENENVSRTAVFSEDLHEGR